MSTILISFFSDKKEYNEKDFTVPVDITVSQLKSLLNLEDNYILLINNEKFENLKKFTDCQEEKIFIEIKKEKKERQKRNYSYVSGEVSGHTNGILAICDDLTGGGDGTVRSWNLQMKSGLKVFKNHMHWVQIIANIRENEYLSGAVNGTLVLFNKETNEKRELKHFKSRITGIHKFFREEKIHIAISSADSTVKIFDGDFNLIKSYSHNKPVNCIFINKNILYSCCTGNKIVLYDLEGLSYIREYRTTSPIYIIKKYDNIVFFGADCGSIYYLLNEKLVSIKNQRTRIMNILKVGDILIILFYDGLIYFYKKMKKVKEFMVYGKIYASYLNDDILYIGLENGMIKIYKIENNKMEMEGEYNCGSEIFVINKYLDTMMVGLRNGKLLFF